MVQTIIKKHARQGYTSIIIGDKDHPEVVGLLGYSDGKGYVIDNINGLDYLPAFEKAIIVAQTTQNTQFFEEVKKWADKNSRTTKSSILFAIPHQSGRQK